MITLRDGKYKLRIFTFNDKRYVLGMDLAKYCGYRQEANVINRLLKGVYILEDTKLPGQNRRQKRQLVDAYGVELFLEKATKTLNNDQLSFIYNKLLPTLEEYQVIDRVPKLEERCFFCRLKRKLRRA